MSDETYTRAELDLARTRLAAEEAIYASEGDTPGGEGCQSGLQRLEEARWVVAEVMRRMARAASPRPVPGLVALMRAAQRPLPETE